MAKVNMNYKFRTLEGETVPRDTGKTRKVIKDKKEIKEAITEDSKLKHVCIDALLNPETEIGPDLKPRAVEIDGNKKFDRWDLASKIHSSNGILDISSDEKAQLKTLVGKRYGPLVVGQAWKALEGKIGLEPEKKIPSNK